MTHSSGVYIGDEPRFRSSSLLVVSQLAAAQSYPAKPIRLVVGLAPGGATDIMARTLVPRLSRTSSVSRSSSTTARAPPARSARRSVAKAPPDGYTLFLASSELHVERRASEERRLRSDRATSTPITNVASGPFLLVVRTSLPVKSVASSSPTRRRTRASSTSPRAASAAPRISPASCSSAPPASR